MEGGRGVSLADMLWRSMVRAMGMLPGCRGDSSCSAYLVSLILEESTGRAARVWTPPPRLADLINQVLIIALTALQPSELLSIAATVRLASCRRRWTLNAADAMVVQVSLSSGGTLSRSRGLYMNNKQLSDLKRIIYRLSPRLLSFVAPCLQRFLLFFIAPPSR